MNNQKRATNNFFDGIPLSAPQIMIILIMMTAFFFQQYCNWGFNFLVVAILKSQDLSGKAANAAMAAITQWYFLGMTLGGILGGLFSDLAGRRKAMLVGMLVFSLASVITAFTDNLTIFVAARSATGFGIFFLMIAAQVYVAEMTPAESRGRWLCLVAAVGFSAAPASALLSRLTLDLSPDAWRYVLMLGGLGIVPFCMGLVYLKESPRWLVAHGRHAEAEALVEDLTGYAVELPAPAPAERRSGPAVLEMFSRPYLPRTIMLLALFILYTPATFFNAFWLPQMLSNLLTTQDTANIMQYASCGVPLGCLLAAALVERGGRKLPLAAFILLAAAASFAMWLSSTHFQLLVVGFLTQVSAMCSSFAMFIYAVEQYPTRFRNGATGILNGLGRFAVSGFQPLVVLFMAGKDVRNVFLAVTALFVASFVLVMVWGRKTSGLALETCGEGDAVAKGAG